jgi:hypothetical protein
MHLSRVKIALLAASLASCYAQVEDTSVVVTHSLCTPSTSDCLPGGGAGIPAGAGGGNTFTVPFGDVPLLKSSASFGPATLRTTLVLNRSTFTMGGTPGANFSGITQVQLLSAPTASTGPGNDPCASPPTPCPVIAAYNKATDGAADQQIVLKTQIPNLVDLIDPTTHQIIFEVQAQGQAPTPLLWRASFGLDLAIKSRAGIP